MKRIVLLFLVGWITTGCGPRGGSVEAEHELVSAVFSDVWSKGNVELVPALFSESYVGHFPGGDTVRGREDLASAVMAHRGAFPDWTEEVERVIIDHEWLAVRFKSSGTNTGEFLGNPPTGNRVEISEVVIFRLEDGRIAEQWVYPDMLSLQRQLSVRRE